MAFRRVKISVDTDLLAEVDRQPETQKLGRSAVIRSALRLYLNLKRRNQIDRAYERAYAGKADALLEEFGEFLSPRSQAPAGRERK